MTGVRSEEHDIPRFDRSFFSSGGSISRIGDGEIGGKARGLVSLRAVLLEEFGQDAFSELEIDVPAFVVISTTAFDAFMTRNGLDDVARSDLPDDRIAHAFLRAQLPTEIVGDLRALVEEVRSPLAVRSSSLLEDALQHPFAGVYDTKMTPNNQPDPRDRFSKLVEAIKFVYASTFFRAARAYARAIDRSVPDEKMAVILQEVVGQGHGERFYPAVSGVGRSYSFYPMPGASPEDGVVELALGLGKTIVDGGLAYSYCPARPKAPPPYSTVGELMQNSQRSFWAINVGKPPSYDPLAETEYLVEADLQAAEYDGTLSRLASTYVAASDRLTAGTGPDGPRVLDFAPLLRFRDVPFNEAVRRLLVTSERVAGSPVEVEFAMNLPTQRSTDPARLRFLQLRSIRLDAAAVCVTEEELGRDDLLLASDRVMGNGVIETMHDIVFVKRDAFSTRHTRTIAAQLARINGALLDARRPYLLIGFGRWGSADPFLGIPVNWSQICGAKVIVEASCPGIAIEASQGSHFFHNMTSFQVGYLYVSDVARRSIDWDWLGSLPSVMQTDLVSHVRLDAPLLAKLDGKKRLGAIWKGPRETDAR